MFRPQRDDDVPARRHHSPTLALGRALAGGWRDLAGFSRDTWEVWIVDKRQRGH